MTSLTTIPELMPRSDDCEGDDLTTSAEMVPRSDDREGDELNDDLRNDVQVRLLSG